MQKNYLAKENRYDDMLYRRVGKSGLLLPAISLGLWHNFGSIDSFENQREMLTTAFDLGVTHFDLANNYGPEAGSAEELFGLHLKKDFKKYRDELIISSKAGYYMWEGPYGDGGSRKHIIASANQSLRRMRCNYFDIFYSHRPDPETPIEETIGALNTLVQQGKALYVGISSYTAAQTKAAFQVARDLGLKLLIHQPNYSMFDRWVEEDETGEGLLKTLDELGMGSIVFAPLSQGLLTDKYLNGIPENSRAAKPSGFLSKESITEAKLSQIRDLNELAKARGQKLSQMALAWVLRDNRVTSALIGASRKEQIVENVATLKNLEFTVDELRKIDDILARDDLTNSDKRNSLNVWHYIATHNE
jgi:L-glyceraldehyde 3-phosphate reductase